MATVTEIHDYMRLLFARVGKTICRDCGRKICAEPPRWWQTVFGKLPEGTRLLIGYDLPLVDMAKPPVDDAAEPGDEEVAPVAEPSAAAAPLSVISSSAVRDSAGCWWIARPCRSTTCPRTC